MEGSSRGEKGRLRELWGGGETWGGPAGLPVSSEVSLKWKLTG